MKKTNYISKTHLTNTSKKIPKPPWIKVKAPQSSSVFKTKDIVKQFNQSFVFPKNEGKFNVNLQAQALNDLASIGFDINKVNIFEDCTFCEEKKYHSYRRSSNDVGRMIGLIGIKR